MGSIVKVATKLLLLFSYCAIATQVLQKCTRDVDCSGPNKGHYFCYDMKCEDCVPCGITFYRYPPVTGCARTEDECGLCLPGYTSKSLTHQRKSSKCFLITSLSEGFLPSASISAFAVGIFELIFLIGLLATVYITNRKSVTKSDKLVHQRNSPPHDKKSMRMASYSSQLVNNLCEQENDVVPIMDESSDRFALEGSSTETIPSLWEPRDSQSSPQRRAPLVKCQSLVLLIPQEEFHRLKRTNRSQSNPIFSAEMDTDGMRRLGPIAYYQHHHVQLSVHRLQDRFVCSMEPIPPLAFSFIRDQDSLVGTTQSLHSGGLLDSVFFDNNDLDHFVLSVTFCFKRRRDSE